VDIASIVEIGRLGEDERESAASLNARIPALGLIAGREVAAAAGGSGVRKAPHPCPVYGIAYVDGGDEVHVIDVGGHAGGITDIAEPAVADLNTRGALAVDP
jgi:hypothetical protein